MELVIDRGTHLIYNAPIMGEENTKNIDFAALCKSIRMETGLKQREMADKLGVTLRAYQKYEAGEIKPHGEAAFLLAVMDMERKFAALVKGVKDSADKPIEKPTEN